MKFCLSRLMAMSIGVILGLALLLIAPLPASSQVMAPGLLYSQTASVSTGTGTGEQVLATYSLPVGALSATGDRLRISGSFKAAADGNNKTYIVYFGSSTISSGVVTNNGTAVPFEMNIVKTGSSTQNVTAWMNIGTTVSTPVATTGSNTDTALITIKATGTDGTSLAGDIVLVDLKVEKLK